MKYGTDDALRQIAIRSRKIEVRKNERRTRIFGGISGICVLSLILVIALIPGHGGEAPPDSVYGSFLLSAEAGGYILAAVIAFVLGAAVTLLCVCLRKRKKQKTEFTGNNDPNDQNGGTK